MLVARHAGRLPVSGCLRASTALSTHAPFMPPNRSAATGPRPRSRPITLIAVMGLGLLLEACASPGPVARPLTIPAPRLESERMEATRPPERAILTFAWRLNERGSRVEGRGVARVDPPYRVRLDLFTENGETAARAALVDSDLRVPPDVDRRLVPPPPLLWASLGVFHPGSEAALLGGEALVDPTSDAAQGSGPLDLDPDEDQPIRLRYRMANGEEARFVFVGRLLEAAELLDGSRVVERVKLERDEAEPPGSGQSRADLRSRTEPSVGPPYPMEAVYRDRSAFRELRVTVESREPADSFPADIWLPQW